MLKTTLLPNIDKPTTHSLNINLFNYFKSSKPNEIIDGDRWNKLSKIGQKKHIFFEANIYVENNLDKHKNSYRRIVEVIPYSRISEVLSDIKLASLISSSIKAKSSSFIIKITEDINKYTKAEASENIIKAILLSSGNANYEMPFNILINCSENLLQELFSSKKMDSISIKYVPKNLKPKDDNSSINSESSFSRESLRSLRSFTSESSDSNDYFMPHNVPNDVLIKENSILYLTLLKPII